MKPRLAPFLGLLASILLAMTAFPRLMSALYLLYPEQIDKQYRQNPSAISLNQHHDSEIAIKKALEWSESAEAWQYLSIAQTRQLQDTDESAQRLLQGVYHSTMKGLSLSPVDPYSWYRLAVIERTLEQPNERIVNDLRLSSYAGRVEPKLLLKRIRLMYAYRTQLNDEMRDIMLDQIRLAGLLQFRGLIQLAYELPGLTPDISKALQYEPELWNRFLQSLDKFTRKTPVTP